MEDKMSNEASITNSLLEFMVLSHTKMVRPLNESFKPVLSPLQTNVILLLKIYGSMSMTQLTDKLMMPKQQMTQIAHHLEEIGFVARNIDRNDRRRIIVDLTAKANDYIDENVAAYMGKSITESKNLTAREKKQLSTTLDTLNTLLSKITVE